MIVAYPRPDALHNARAAGARLWRFLARALGNLLLAVICFDLAAFVLPAVVVRVAVLVAVLSVVVRMWRGRRVVKL